MQRTILVLAIAAMLPASCKRDKTTVAAKATAQGGLTIINTTAYPLSLNFRAHDAAAPSACGLEGGSLYVGPQTTLTYNGPADLNASPSWYGSNVTGFNAPGDWDGVKGGFINYGGSQIGNISSCMTDSSWSEYFPSIGTTLHMTWRHINGAYELRAF